MKPELSLDKVAHLLMYLAFAFITLWGYRLPYRERGKAFRSKALWITLLVSVSFGALTELMQEFFIPSRFGSVYDWIADVIGSILGVTLFYFLYKKRNNLGREAFCK